jgi:predicted outer membrane repeat protein
MKRIGFCLLPLVLWACAGTPKPGPGQDTYYVMAGGSDRNDGLSEQTPFRSLFKALVVAADSSVKTITVVGTLNVASEQSSHIERVFLIQGTGKEAILIRGKPSGTEPAALSAADSGRRVILVKGPVNIRFEDIEISGGSASGDGGGGMGIGPGSLVTLGSGAVLRDNSSESIGGGIVIAPGGSLIVDGGRILNNRSAAVGGGIAVVGKTSVLTVKDGEISGNHGQGGGGVAVYQDSNFTLSGGVIHDNTADLAGGGVVINQGGIFTMEGGIIRGNRSSGSGGGAALLVKGTVTCKGGEIHGNRAAEHGGGIASDETSTIIVQGGFISANRAASRGGGIFSAGAFVKSGGTIYGNDVPEDESNVAPAGAAVFVYLNDDVYKVREKSAGENLILDGSADDGWILTSSEKAE